VPPGNGTVTVAIRDQPYGKNLFEEVWSFHLLAFRLQLIPGKRATEATIRGSPEGLFSVAFALVLERFRL
jgi:hypothetical protein